ncbi:MULTISPECIES: Na+/H+ antiporter subunit G [Sediminimonas]|uniref:Na+/H+ antiporter subunit G n=1 Tax=Sediminimonas qiaohouensis TaxID=552061 RepID=A0A7C9L6Z1_9RHOB|nr:MULTISPECIES: Na+/H+ antiporter subunit G [Sediminimonas]MDR9484171.1 Na+/H+ antiporter subunit G [Sediminimonas sp.]MTJ04193.1 Na+/H+ antiporter subunit G [Sediminimonas qiaohouensis]
MIVDILISAFLVISGIFGLVGSVGLIKLPHPMMRLHAPTKATTLGVGGALIASLLYFYFVAGRFSYHELMITLFLFLTAPITGNFIAKVHIHRHETRDSLPSTGSERPWATFESDEDRIRAEGHEL